MNLLRLKLAVGTLFGAGLFPVAPGTVGSLLTLPLIYAAVLLSPGVGLLLLLVTTILLSLWSASAAVEKYGEDPAQFVMDESAGQTLTFVSAVWIHNITESLSLLLIGFLLFRLFDILKPLGINRVQNAHGSLGILADDLLAGLYALLVLEFLIRVLPFF